MDTRESVDLASLSTRFTTRRRGEEAYVALSPTLESGVVVLHLDGTDSLSTSFLDGLLLKLVTGNHLPNVLFETNDARKRTILGRLSSVRSIDIQLLNEQGNVEKVRPVPYKSFPVELVENKSYMKSPALSSSAGATHV